MFKSNKSKWILTLIGFVLVAIVLLSFGARISANEKTVSLNFTNYAIGSIDSTTGHNIESSKFIRTNSFSNVKDMEIKLTDDASISYIVFFYDTEKEYLECTDVLDDDFDVANIPEDAKYFKIVIKPNQIDGEDVNITILNKSKYAGMLKVSCSK